MAEYIDRGSATTALISAFGWGIRKKKCIHDILCSAKDRLEELPAADVAPVVHGTPIIKHRHFGGFKQYTGVDAMGETHTITVDERWECDAKHCPECQALLCSRFENYCPNCGAKMDCPEKNRREPPGIGKTL